MFAGSNIVLSTKGDRMGCMKKTFVAGLLLGTIAMVSATVAAPSDAQAHPCTHWECGYYSALAYTESWYCPQYQGGWWYTAYYYDLYVRRCDMPSSQPPGSCSQWCSTEDSGGCYQYTYLQDPVPPEYGDCECRSCQ
jgi:hypothetical protein